MGDLYCTLFWEILPTNIGFSFPDTIAAICTMDNARKNKIGKRPLDPMREAPI